MSKNADVAALLNEIADLLELKEDKFRPVAYRRAAERIRMMSDDVEELVKQGRVHEVPGVGASIAQKVTEYVEKGKAPYLERLKKEVPGGLAELMHLPGLGSKRVSQLNQELGIKDAASLRKAAEDGRIAKLPGMGGKTQQAILQALDRQETTPERHLFTRGLEAAERFIALIEATGKVERVEKAGSLRRGRDTVGDVDIVASAAEKDARAVMDAFCGAGGIDEVIAHGEKKSSIRLPDGLQVDLRVVTPDQYGAALLYFTGSKEHNVALRKRAQGYGWTLNEYGLVRKKDEKRLAGNTEEEIYKKLKFPWIPPELREDRGEIDAAKKDKLPRLVERKDIVADLHTHTTDSDGRGSARQMLEGAREAGLKVYGISDHSYSLHLPKGDASRLRNQRAKLDKLREEFDDLLILQGSEVNIKKDGSLDTPAGILGELDYVIGSIHGSFDLDEKEQTRRILKAVEQGIDILGHPTARRMPRRAPVAVDEAKVFQACADNGVFLEIDGQPERMDLPGELVQRAKEVGCRFTVDSDAHSTKSLAFLDHAVTQARRGWLEVKDLLSAETPAQIQKTLGRAKRK